MLFFGLTFDRTEEDVDVLLEFTQHLKAFTNMTLSVRRALVATMVFAVVEKAGNQSKPLPFLCWLSRVILFHSFQTSMYVLVNSSSLT